MAVYSVVGRRHVPRPRLLQRRNPDERTAPWPLASLGGAWADAGNRVGSKKLYDTLKYREESNGRDAYPSRPFVEDFIQRQKYSQTHKRIKAKSDTIQAVLTSRPNQLLQVDYVYFYWATDGIEDVRKDGPWDEAALSASVCG